MKLRAVYVDVDGTLVGPGGCLFRNEEGRFSHGAVQALELCYRGNIEVVLVSGRRRDHLFEAARLVGARSFAAELGAVLGIDGDVTHITGDWQPQPGRSIHRQIEEEGAPALLLERYRGALEPHAPWHAGREVSHLFRGLVDVDEVNRLLAAVHPRLRLVDNGELSSSSSSSLDLDGPPHAYHLLPAGVSKAWAIRVHRGVRRYTPDECIAVGDSLEDLGMVDMVRRLYLVANADVPLLPGLPSVIRTRAAMGEGLHEAIVHARSETG